MKIIVDSSAEIKVIDFKNGGIVCLKRDEEGAWSVGWVVVVEILK